MAWLNHERPTPLPALLYDPSLGTDRVRLLETVKDAEGLIVRNQTLVNPELLERAPHLRVVGRLGVGLDNIDTGALSRRGIALVLPRGANAVAVGEHTMAVLLVAARSLDTVISQTRAGAWKRSARGTELQGKRLTLVGLGHTGRAVATRALAFGMQITGYDPRMAPGHSLFQPGAIRRADSLVEAVGAAHYVSLHLPLTPDTHHLINATVLGKMPPGSFLVNTSRGGLLDEQALLEALDRGHLAGAALDVRVQEPPPPDDRLLTHPRVISTPHVAGLTHEAQDRIATYVIREVCLRL